MVIGAWQFMFQLYQLKPILQLLFKLGIFMLEIIVQKRLEVGTVGTYSSKELLPL
jgi:hypothetical protein